MRCPWIKNEKNSTLCDAKIIKKLFEKVLPSERVQLNLNEDLENKEYIFTAWMNGIPDLDRNSIKIGIRNKDYSITCEGFLTQVFGSLRVMGIYNMKQDEDEINSIEHTHIKEKDIEYLYNELKEKWVELISSIIIGSDNRYGFRSKYNYIIEDTETYKRWNNISNREK